MTRHLSYNIFSSKRLDEVFMVLLNLFNFFILELLFIFIFWDERSFFLGRKERKQIWKRIRNSYIKKNGKEMNQNVCRLPELSSILVSFYASDSEHFFLSCFISIKLTGLACEKFSFTSMFQLSVLIFQLF